MANTVSSLISDEQLNRIMQIESAGNPNARAGTSSAAGLGQFISGTWLAVVKKHRPDLLKSRQIAEVLGMRVGMATASLQLELLARFTEDNAKALGAGFTDGDLYLAHFLGIGDARNVFRASQADLASRHVTPGALKANPTIIPGKSCAQLRAWAQSSMVSRWEKAGKKDWVAKFADKRTAPPATKPAAPIDTTKLPEVPLKEVPLKPAPLPTAPKPPAAKKPPVVTPKRVAMGFGASVLAWLASTGWKLALVAALIFVAVVVGMSVYKKATSK